ncbi:hypothetical protein E4P82_10485 [Candidatus Competibacter phosphatis]|uniref:Uncharacterized protein n=1 Tax=Candidatus Competibacter phosphatis TaxID=221280 RepID=A0ABX1TLP0_9GAMM|nr:hypothetical protein [Candidatus Competibacter phosphatis]NMQ19584.1 hypothetical protein [Candidatus Competibacter phosphatis]
MGLSQAAKVPGSIAPFILILNIESLSVRSHHRLQLELQLLCLGMRRIDLGLGVVNPELDPTTALATFGGDDL